MLLHPFAADNQPRYDRIEMLSVSSQNNKSGKGTQNTLWKGGVSKSVTGEGIAVQFNEVEVLSQSDVQAHLHSPLSPRSNNATVADSKQLTATSKANALQRYVAKAGTSVHELALLHVFVLSFALCLLDCSIRYRKFKINCCATCSRCWQRNF